MSNPKHKFSILQTVRLLLQILFFLFLPALCIGALNGVKEIYQAILHQNFSAALIPQIVEAAVIIPVTVLFGRFFCGWMCAFGSFGEFIYMIFHKVFPKKVHISERTDRLLKSVKYIVLAVLVIVVWGFELPLFRTASPWDAFGMLATVGKTPDFSYVTTSLTVGFILLLGIIAGSAVIERFFCRYLCPLGAIFSIASRPRIAKIKKPSAQCGSCRACTNQCAMGIPLYKMDKVSTGECIHCMKCVTVCPRGNADFTVARSDVRPLLAGTAAAAAMAGMYCSAEFALNLTGAGTTVAVSSAVSSSESEAAPAKAPDTQENENSGQGTSSSSTAPQPTGSYKDGTYHGTGDGFRGATSVSVVVSGGKIIEISVDSYQDDDRFFNHAYSAVSQEIISSQSAEVDAVSGATFSSMGIMNAVADALKSAVKA